MLFRIQDSKSRVEDTKQLAAAQDEHGMARSARRMLDLVLFRRRPANVPSFSLIFSTKYCVLEFAHCSTTTARDGGASLEPIPHCPKSLRLDATKSMSVPETA